MSSSLSVGDSVFVWSKSDKNWVAAEVDDIVDDQRIHVTYHLEGFIAGKELHFLELCQKLPVAQLGWYAPGHPEE